MPLTLCPGAHPGGSGAAGLTEDLRAAGVGLGLPVCEMRGLGVWSPTRGPPVLVHRGGSLNTRGVGPAPAQSCPQAGHQAHAPYPRGPSEGHPSSPSSWGRGSPVWKQRLLLSFPFKTGLFPGHSWEGQAKKA